MASTNVLPSIETLHVYTVSTPSTTLPPCIVRVEVWALLAIAVVLTCGIG